MFVTDERVLPVSFDEASARLSRLIRGDRLLGLSENVYQGGVDYLVRVGPLGAVPGASRLVRVRFAEPVLRPGMMSVALRWEATGVTGALFPALDADIRLSDEDDGVRVELTGSYRPPLGALGTELDRLLLHTVATATIRTLLVRIAAVLEDVAERAADEPVLGRLPGRSAQHGYRLRVAHYIAGAAEAGADGGTGAVDHRLDAAPQGGIGHPVPGACARSGPVR
jgi:hypothetical protein